MFEYNAVAVLALIAVAMCWSLAIVLFRVGASGSVARKLSLLLVVEGTTLISTGFLDLLLTEAVHASSWHPNWLLFESVVHTLGDCLMLVLYPSFLAAALRTPLTRPLATGPARIAISLIAAALFVAVYTTPLAVGATTLYLMLTLVFVYALIASVHAWRYASGGARARARSFAMAFGIRDICWGFVYGFAIVLIVAGEYDIVDDASSFVYVVYALGTLLAVPLIAYGILKTQLFDIDLKIRWTIRQSTIAAAFVAVFYLVTEGADRVLASEFGNWIGLLASAMLVFFLAPLQRFAERVASLAMPNTRNTVEYAAFRKLQVYSAALEDALPGGISEKERTLLNHLRDSLEIAPGDAEALEEDMRNEGG